MQPLLDPAGEGQGWLLAQLYRLAVLDPPRSPDAADAILIELDERRRVSFGKLGRHSRYLAREEADGTLIFEPAVVMTELEARFMANRELVARIEESRKHPERLRRRRTRPAASQEQ